MANANFSHASIKYIETLKLLHKIKTTLEKPSVNRLLTAANKIPIASYISISVLFAAALFPTLYQTPSNSLYLLKPRHVTRLLCTGPASRIVSRLFTRKRELGHREGNEGTVDSRIGQVFGIISLAREKRAEVGGREWEREHGRSTRFPAFHGVQQRIQYASVDDDEAKVGISKLGHPVSNWPALTARLDSLRTGIALCELPTD